MSTCCAQMRLVDLPCLMDPENDVSRTMTYYYKAFRLAALTCDPDAFASSYLEVSRKHHDFWHSRQCNPRATHFVAIPRELLEASLAESEWIVTCFEKASVDLVDCQAIFLRVSYLAISSPHIPSRVGVGEVSVRHPSIKRSERLRMVATRRATNGQDVPSQSKLTTLQLLDLLKRGYYKAQRRGVNSITYRGSATIGKTSSAYGTTEVWLRDPADGTSSMCVGHVQEIISHSGFVVIWRVPARDV